MFASLGLKGWYFSIRRLAYSVLLRSTFLHGAHDVGIRPFGVRLSGLRNKIIGILAEISTNKCNKGVLDESALVKQFLFEELMRQKAQNRPFTFYNIMPNREDARL